VLAFGVIELAGKLIRHAMGVLLLSWQRMLRFGLSVGVLAFLAAEAGAALMTRTFPPALVTHAVAMVFALVMAYAAALTVLLDELLLGLVDTVGLLEGDLRAGLRAAAVVAEREAGEAGGGIMRWLGHPRPEDQGAAPTSSEMDAESSETRQAIAQTDAFHDTAPRPRVNARPVRADQLPRIPWAYEPGDLPPAGASSARETAAPPLPPLPVATPLAAERDAPATPPERDA
jgi:hypothetical protein